MIHICYFVYTATLLEVIRHPLDTLTGSEIKHPTICIQNLMSEGNVIFILPKTSVERKPLYLNRGFGERVIHGGGSFTDESER